MALTDKIIYLAYFCGVQHVMVVVATQYGSVLFQCKASAIKAELLLV